tara:strand:- start:346 stop:1029 length:684 start_codon:yes stop_codon:yes gene_type:complete
MNKKVIVALDNNNIKKTIKIANIVKNEVHSFKIGYEFFFNFGINGYKDLQKVCPNIFLDLKLHDIPNTVKHGIDAILKLKPILTTIHISGGDDMMKASKLNKSKTKILGVSVLTSLDDRMVKKYYNENNISIIVKKYVKEAKQNKLDGVVCSPKEIKLVRKEVGKKFLIITPGIRFSENIIENDDQERTMTPKEAIKLGADLIVIGRPITQSKDPLKVIKNINKSIL